LSQIVSLLMAPTDEDYDSLLKVNVVMRVLYLEHHRTGEDFMQIEHLASIPLPRTLKTHLPFRFISRWVREDGVKTIVTTRNPKDTIVSLYHFNQQNTREWIQGVGLVIVPYFLYHFNRQNTREWIQGVGLVIVPYFLYHFNQQNTREWVQGVGLVIVPYFLYHFNQQNTREWVQGVDFANSL
jgi:hypothetical protein